LELDIEKLKKRYRKQEVTSLILMLVALPIFGIVYLYYTSGNLDWDLPQIPDFFRGLMIGSGYGLLIGQFFIFRDELKKAKSENVFEGKVMQYLRASQKRVGFLFLISLISTVGLLFFQSAWFVIMFALALVFFSLAKITPDRMKRLLKLSKEEGEIARLISRP